MRLLRTPEDRFVDLPGYAFEPHYATVGDGIRVHYLDEGPADGDVVVLMHGEPSWSYLYRTMVPRLVDAGLRVVAPDLVGFGKSDKPADRADCTYARHVAWMSDLLVEHLDLTAATLVGQDWGGLIGLRVVASAPARFARLVVANTGLPTGDQRMSDAFRAWQTYAETSPTFPIGRIVAGGCAEPLEEAVAAAYDAPFPDASYKEAARIFPSLVPTTPDDPAAADNRAAWEVLRRWDKPLLCAFSDRDMITAGGDKPFRELVPGAAGQPHVTIEGGGHFLQEDRGPEFARAIVTFLGRS